MDVAESKEVYMLIKIVIGFTGAYKTKKKVNENN